MRIALILFRQKAIHAHNAVLEAQVEHARRGSTGYVRQSDLVFLRAEKDAVAKGRVEPIVAAGPAKQWVVVAEVVAGRQRCGVHPVAAYRTVGKRIVSPVRQDYGV